MQELSRRSSPPRRLPPVSENALLWKEMLCDQSMVPSEPRAFLGCLYVCVAFVLILLGLIALGSTSDLVAANFFHGFSQWVGMGIVGFMSFAAALNAAGRVTREREKQTLDNLFTIPCQREDILFAKWLASFLSVRWWFVPLTGVWALGLATGGMAISSVPLLIGATIVCVATATSLGLFLSTYLPTTLRATLVTVLSGLVFMSGPGLVWHSLRDRGATATALDHFMGYALTPPAFLTTLNQFPGHEDMGQPKTWLLMVMILVGLHIYMAMSVVLWLATVHLFKRDQGRSLVRKREGATKLVANAPEESVPTSYSRIG